MQCAVDGTGVRLAICGSNTVCRVQVKLFEEAQCAAVETRAYEGTDVVQRIHGTQIGTRVVVGSLLIEFPDDNMMQQLNISYADVRFCSQRRLEVELGCCGWCLDS